MSRLEFSGNSAKDLEKCKKRQEKFMRKALGKCGRLCYPKSEVFWRYVFRTVRYERTSWKAFRFRTEEGTI